MVNLMYKETVKSPLSPVTAVLVWFISTYLFFIFWGIAQILFEFNMPYIKIGLCFLGTVYFGIFLITKILTEFKIEITDEEFIVKSVLAKREKIIVIVPKDTFFETRNEHKGKALNLTRPYQKGKSTYLIFKNEEKEEAIKIKQSEKLIELLKEGKSD